VRLFVALEVQQEARQELDRRVSGLRGRLPRARWVDLGNVHLTLLFLGETGEAAVAGLVEALRPAFARCPALDLQLRDGGTFPPRGPARVAWVGVEAPAALQALHGEVTAAAVEALGIEPEARPFSAHLTLARCSEPWKRDATETWKAALAGPIGPAFRVDRGTLFESVLGRGGARYSAVAELEMAGSA